MFSAEDLISQIKEETGMSKIFTYAGSPPRYLYSEATNQGVEISQVVREQHILHLAQTRYYRKLERGEKEIPVVIVSGEMGEAMMSQPLLAGSISAPCLILVAEGRFEHVDNALNIAHQSDRGSTPDRLDSEKALNRHDNIAGRKLLKKDKDLEELGPLMDEIRDKKEIGIIHVPLYALKEFDEPKREEEDFSIQVSECTGKELSERFKQAERPLIMVGRGVKKPGRREKVKEIAKDSGAAIATTLQMEGYFDENYVGRIGTMGTPLANRAFNRSDLVVALGTSVNNLITSYDPENIEEFKRKTVQVEENPKRESIFVDSWLKEDTDSAIEALEGIDGDGWMDQDAYGSEEKREHVPDIMNRLGALMRESWSEKTVNLGVGNHMLWMSYALGPEVKKEVSRTGSMGEAVSGINREENPVIVLGDGEFEMDLSMILEAYYQDRRPNFFVINNTRLGMVNEQQEAEFDKMFTQKVERPVEYGKLEEVFSEMNSYTVDTAEGLENVFEKVKESKESLNLVEVRVDARLDPELYSTSDLPT